MAKITVPILIALLISSLTVAPAFGQDLNVCDYSSIESKVTLLNLSGSYHQFDDRYSDDRGNADNGNIALKGRSWMDSPEWGYQLDGMANVQLSSVAALFNYSLSSSNDFRRYLNDNFFLFGGLDSIGTPTQSGFILNVLAGGGYGRFKDVSPLAKAFAIVASLREQGLLDERPSDDVMLGLAQAIGEQTAPGLSAELLSIIESSMGSVLELDAVFSIDALLRKNITRFCGWDATISLGYEAVSPSSTQNAILRSRVNYAIAIDPLTQLELRARFSAPLASIQRFSLQGEIDVERSLSADTELSLAYLYFGQSQESNAVDSPTMSNTHIISGSVQTQVSTALSVLFKSQVVQSTGFEEPEWSLDISFAYKLF